MKSKSIINRGRASENSLKKDGAWGFEKVGKADGLCGRNRKTGVGKEASEMGEAHFMQVLVALLRTGDLI